VKLTVLALPLLLPLPPPQWQISDLSQGSRLTGGSQQCRKTTKDSIFTFLTTQKEASRKPYKMFELMLLINISTQCISNSLFKEGDHNWLVAIARLDCKNNHHKLVQLSCWKYPHLQVAHYNCNRNMLRAEPLANHQ
jgi:hypothetical protein